MKKIALTLFSLFASLAVIADTSINTELCQYSTQFNVDINPTEVVFAKSNGDSYQFAGDMITLNGKPLQLKDEEIIAARALQQRTRAVVPKVAAVAIEAGELAIKATSKVLTSLFGGDDQEVQREFLAPIEAMNKKLKQNINENSINAAGLDEAFDKTFNEEFEQAIENAVLKNSGKFASNLISAIFSGDSEELKDFEFRMESLEHEIDNYIEVNAKALEDKANALCKDMAELEKWDAQLEGISGYPKNGIIEKGAGEGFKWNKISIN